MLTYNCIKVTSLMNSIRSLFVQKFVTFDKMKVHKPKDFGQHFYGMHMVQAYLRN